MNTKIDEKVSVNLVYDHTIGKSQPKHIKWRNRVYTMTKTGFHYTLFHGNQLIHMFAVNNDDTYFLLAFNTHTLNWKLEEITDSLSSHT